MLLLLKATELGLGSIVLGLRDAKAIRALLNIPDEEVVVSVICIGYRNDPSFIPAGAEAFLKDLPEAEIHFVDSGHFALESHADEIALLMIPFLKKHIQ